MLVQLHRPWGLQLTKCRSLQFLDCCQRSIIISTLPLDRRIRKSSIRSYHQDNPKRGEGKLKKQSSADIHEYLDRFLGTVKRRIENLLYTKEARDKDLTRGLTEKEFERIVFKFRDETMKNLKERLRDGKYLEAPARIPSPEELFDAYNNGGYTSLDHQILTKFRLYAIVRPTVKGDTSELIRVADMRKPGEWYPGARSMRRKIIMHVGPTNSGKTYQALCQLESAKSGWYGGPLRLLAHEIFHRMNEKGIKCNLKTGEEIRMVDINAPITSSTIEMFSDSMSYDVAVIDEIQMIADPARGHAWTAALLGVKAKEIHLCGEEAAIPLVKKIAEDLGEEVEVHTYKRLSPLTTAAIPIDGFHSLVPGDCVVAFSRALIFSLRDRIEKECGLRCALVYGSLPSETRTLQANLFNDPKSGYDVIVASDAIGMGLNL